ncbi:hypothetical protein ACA910_003162 [Epithemia clementina (nom. ined.)]
MLSVLLMSLVAYVAILAFAMYFCMFADPETSSIAQFFQETAPTKCWDLCLRTVGAKNLKALEWISDRAMILIYCVVVFGSWSIIFYYVYPWISRQTYVSHVHKIVGYFVFAACVICWRYASTSSPGIITKQTVSLYDHFPYDELMFPSKKMCPTRKIPRLARSKFDRFKYNENVPRFDHFCGWVFNTIGEENYRWFLLFLAVHVGMCLYGTVVLTSLFYGHILEKNLHKAVLFNRATGEELPPGNFLILSQYLFSKFFLEAGVLMLMAVMAVCLGLFLCYHAWITSRGLTTNECFKWDEIKKWYQTEKKRYQDALKQGKATTETKKKAEPPTVSDGDVTCTPGQKTSAQTTTLSGEVADDDDLDAIVDPGPPPVNIYNRGLYENWKEVIFPISLRKKRKLKAAAKNKAN